MHRFVAIFDRLDANNRDVKLVPYLRRFLRGRFQLGHCAAGLRDSAYPTELGCGSDVRRQDDRFSAGCADRVIRDDDTECIA
jgi:hypothetical protein